MLKRILMLDDNPDILDIVKEALIYEKFEVNITTDSTNFIQTIKNFKPDLLILDYKLHGPKGDEICRQVKKNNQLFGIPVIICTAYLNDGDTISCGCDAIITKPFGLDELMEKVNSLVYS
jgi:DNA-binding response OmpR family regulator